MTDDQMTFLEGRFQKAVLEQPELKQLEALLLTFGGSFIVVPPKRDSDVPQLLRSGFLMGGPILNEPMKSSMCHQNVSAIWMKRRDDLIGIATGYVLSEDGLWRQHSWGVLREGLLETTVERHKYFGILLQDAAADHFARCNA